MKKNEERHWSFLVFKRSTWKYRIEVLPLFSISGDGDYFAIVLGWLFWSITFSVEDLNSLPF